MGEGAAEGLRFGLLASGTTLRTWQADAVRSLLEVPGVKMSLLITDTRPTPDQAAVQRAARLLRSRTRLWDTYNNGWVGRRSRALRSVDMSDVLGDLPRVDVEVRKEGYSEYFPDGAVAEIRDHQLDVLLRFAFGIIRGDILDAARHGVWSFHHDDESHYRGSPPAYWELVDGRPVTGAVLQRLTDRLDGGRILHKGWFRSTPHSYVRNVDTVYLGSADWPARICRALLAGDDKAAEGVLSDSTAPVYRKPNDRQTTGFLVSQGKRFVQTQAQALTSADQWEVGVVRAPLHRFLDPDFQPEVHWLGLGNRRQAYTADPFVLPGVEPMVLYERFDHRKRIGEIWQADLNGGNARPAGLPIDGHASYPFVFSTGDRFHCVPQVAGPGVRLFARDGDGWIEEGVVLADVRLLDPTIIRHDDRWWLFGTRSGPWSLTKLYAWWAEDLSGPWRPHLLNPLKTDVRSARPAGIPFHHDGRLFGRRRTARKVTAPR